jgi:hypothetical protein
MVIKRTFTDKQSRLIAWILVLFTTGIGGSRQTWDYVYFSDLQVFQRLTLAQPHYQLAGLLLVASVYFLAKSVDRKSLKYFIIAVATGLLSAHFFAPGMLVIFAALPLYTLVYAIKNGRSVCNQVLPKLLIYIFFTGLPMVYFKYVCRTYPWNMLANGERMFALDFNLADYLLFIGPIIVLAIAGLVATVKAQKVNSFLLLSALWISVHPLFVLLPFSKYGINPLRFLQAPYFFFYGIIGSIGLMRLSTMIKSHFPRISEQVFAGLMVCICLISGIGMYRASIRFITNRNWYGMSKMGYVSRDALAAFGWLRDHTRKQTRIMTGLDTGVLVDAFTTDWAYASSFINANDVDPATYQVLFDNEYRFYAGQMEPAEVAEFWRETQIKYVYFGNDELLHLHLYGAGSELKYAGLTLVYRNPTVYIYKVTQ